MLIEKPKYKCKVLPNGVINELWLNSLDKNIIPANNGWGCELGNWINFFSQLKHLKSAILIYSSNDKLIFKFEVTLPKKSKLQIIESLYFETDKIKQEFKFKVISPKAYIGDLVNRFVIRADLYKNVFIEQYGKINHKNYNIYHQTKNNNVILNGPDNQICITNTASNPYSQVLDAVVYVRDEPKLSQSQISWVIHHRLITKLNTSTNYISRWFYPNILVPNFINKLIETTKLKKSFWRLKERWPKSPISTGGIIQLKQNDKFILSSIIKFN